TVEPRRQGHAVVSVHGLLGVHDDVPLVGESTGDRDLHDLVADHPVADDDERPAGHATVLSSAGLHSSPCTTEVQPPHPVVARVLMATSATELHPASRIAPAVTALHVQTVASSARSAGEAPRRGAKSRPCRSAGSGLPRSKAWVTGPAVAVSPRSSAPTSTSS